MLYFDFELQLKVIGESDAENHAPVGQRWLWECKPIASLLNRWRGARQLRNLARAH
jgi:hypothetical protein